MDDRRFDHLAKSAAAGSRRSLLKVVFGAAIGGALSAAGIESTSAAGKRKIGQICRKDGDCASSFCSAPDSRGRSYCRCNDASDCPTPSNKCQEATCSPSGACSVTTRNCDDGNLCTIDTFDPNIGFINIPKNCDDNNACTVDSCDAATGKCVNRPIDCDDNNACTVDTCHPVNGCTHTPIVCDDNNLCTTNSCDSQLGCIFTAITCDDGNACTRDSCDVQTGQCVHQPIICADFCDADFGCVECLTASDCADFGGQCKTATCDAGVCATVLTDQGVACFNVFNTGACDEFGTCCMASTENGVCVCPEFHVRDWDGVCCIGSLVEDGLCT